MHRSCQRMRGAKAGVYLCFCEKPLRKPLFGRRRLSHLAELGELAVAFQHALQTLCTPFPIKFQMPVWTGLLASLWFAGTCSWDSCSGKWLLLWPLPHLPASTGRLQALGIELYPCWCWQKKKKKSSFLDQSRVFHPTENFAELCM